jgi:ubiquinone/menaquinone biosynthesis C-methylase UbiE
MTLPVSKVQADFDRIALLSEDRWDHNNHYHWLLWRHVPLHCAEALDIGCGTGVFSRLLAGRSDQVVALDLSPQMIKLAKERSNEYSNIDFQVADVMAWEFPVERFDCIVSIATLHHLPFETMLAKMKRALKINGVLIVLDLFQSEGWRNMGTDVFAVPANIMLKLIHLGRLRERDEVRAAWAEHGRDESYLTLSEIFRACAAILPGARVRKHLFWRYSIVWERVWSARND